MALLPARDLKLLGANATKTRGTEPNYWAGGARGEVARGTTEETETIVGTISSRLLTGTIAMTGDCVVTTEAAVEQTGQMCEADGVLVKSAQKWNCAPRKTIPRSNARMRTRLVFTCIYLI